MEARIDIRLDTETKEKLFKDASVAGVSVSEYIRGLIMGAGVTAKKERPIKIRVNTKGVRELPSQEMGGFRTYFK